MQGTPTHSPRPSLHDLDDPMTLGMVITRRRLCLLLIGVCVVAHIDETQADDDDFEPPKVEPSELELHRQRTHEGGRLMDGFLVTDHQAGVSVLMHQGEVGVHGAHRLPQAPFFVALLLDGISAQLP